MPASWQSPKAQFFFQVEECLTQGAHASTTEIFHCMHFLAKCSLPSHVQPSKPLVHAVLMQPLGHARSLLLRCASTGFT